MISCELKLTVQHHYQLPNFFPEDSNDDSQTPGRHCVWRSCLCTAPHWQKN